MSEFDPKNFGRLPPVLLARDSTQIQVERGLPGVRKVPVYRRIDACDPFRLTVIQKTGCSAKAADRPDLMADEKDGPATSGHIMHFAEHFF